MPNYQSTINGSGVLLDGAVIPNDPRNRHRRQLLEYLANGGVIDAAPELALADQKAISAAGVQSEAEVLVAARLPHPSAALVYQLEHAEAVAAMASVDPLDEADYPLLAALIDRLGLDLDEVAQAVIDRQASLVARVAAVHTKRSEVLNLVDSAATSAAALAAVTNISWPADAGAPVSV